MKREGKKVTFKVANLLGLNRRILYSSRQNSLSEDFPTIFSILTKNLFYSHLKFKDNKMDEIFPS